MDQIDFIKIKKIKEINLQKATQIIFQKIWNLNLKIWFNLRKFLEKNILAQKYMKPVSYIS
jgi:hypothetical protein